jgi:glutamate dehydrogenase
MLESHVPDDPYLGRELSRYFPGQLVERFPDALESHRLRREIISTQLTNSMVNRGGPAFVVRIGDQTGAPAATIAAAFFVTRNSYDMIALNTAIDALDNKVSGKVQLDLYAALEELLLDRIVWFVRNVDVSKSLEDVVEHYRAGIEAVAAALDEVLPEEGAKALGGRAASLTSSGVPEDLARRLASLPVLAAAPDIVSVADRTGKPIRDVAATYFAAGAFFQLDRIANAARGINVTDYFDRLALDRALDSIGEAERRLTAEMVGNGITGPEAVEAWVGPRAGDVQRIRAAVHGIASSGLTLSKLSVAASLLGDLVKH